MAPLSQSTLISCTIPSPVTHTTLLSVGQYEAARATV